MAAIPGSLESGGNDIFGITRHRTLTRNRSFKDLLDNRKFARAERFDLLDSSTSRPGFRAASRTNLACGSIKKSSQNRQGSVYGKSSGVLGLPLFRSGVLNEGALEHVMNDAVTTTTTSSSAFIA